MRREPSADAYDNDAVVVSWCGSAPGGPVDRRTEPSQDPRRGRHKLDNALQTKNHAAMTAPPIPLVLFNRSGALAFFPRDFLAVDFDAVVLAVGRADVDLNVACCPACGELVGRPCRCDCLKQRTPVQRRTRSS
jgi:hypothetical protein